MEEKYSHLKTNRNKELKKKAKMENESFMNVPTGCCYPRGDLVPPVPKLSSNLKEGIEP